MVAEWIVTMVKRDLSWGKNPTAVFRDGRFLSVEVNGSMFFRTFGPWFVRELNYEKEPGRTYVPINPLWMWA